MIAPITDMLRDAGPIGVALVAVSLALFHTVARRALALRRGFVGPVERRITRAFGHSNESTRAEPRSPARSSREPAPAASVGLARFIANACAAEAAHRARLLYDARAELTRGRAAVRTLVAVAPLLGLLGTVSGMVEMFGSLHGGLGAAADATVAGGISKALVTTQLGLVIGAPGLVAARLLDRREIRRSAELHEADSRIARWPT